MRERSESKSGNIKRSIILGGAAVLILVLALVLAGCKGGSSNTAQAQTVGAKIQRLVGTVKLYDEKGKELSLKENMKLAPGTRITTAKDSLVMIALDETKLVTLEAESSGKIDGTGKNLEFVIEKGTFFLNVTKKLEADESFDIKISDLVCGIRGTSAYAGIDPSGHTFVMATSGKLAITSLNRRTGDTEETTAEAGDKVMIFLDEEAEGDKTVSFTQEKFKEEDLPALALDAIRKDPVLQQRIAEETGFSIEKIIALADATSYSGESMYGSAAEDLRNQGITDAIPIMGHEARDMANAANGALDVADDDLDLEVAIISGVMKILDVGKTNGASKEELTTLTKKSTECICKTLKTSKEKGLKSGDLVKVANSISDTLVESVNKMERAKLSTKEIDSVIDATAKVYDGYIDVASKESTDKTGAVLGAVDKASSFI